ncbi:MAG: M10 family metallopeptidase C-terminal domain-containing protein [Pelagimonas sp.]|uniref:M10 family metallopeptidase C-terminal domain-containing protein n=1 Tax=Pelagimonas sp. TaxID=2073170 RepID=UPI003D6BB828
MCTLCDASQNFDPNRHMDGGATFDATSAGITSLIASANPADGTIDEMAEYLLSGYWDTAHSFDTSSSNVLTVDLSGLTSEGKQLARWALESWETVANLEFVEVRGNADITFSDDQSGAFSGARYTMDGTTLDATVNVSRSWIASYGSGVTSYTLSTYIHEIGHALGLGHQGGYNGNASFSRDALFGNDSYQMSVMSYFQQDDNPNTDASYAEPMSAMMVDIVAIQTYYGAPGENSPTGGNTTWGEGSTVGTYVDELAGNGLPSDPVAFTIYDVSGTDLINFVSASSDINFNLRDESFSDVGGLIGNVAIARDTLIENLTTGSGDDTVAGNYAGNLIITNDGDDHVSGQLGWDRIWLGNGNDTAFGGDGSDKIGGGAARDSLDGGNGNDTLWGDDGRDTLLGGADDDLLFGGKQDDSMVGGSGEDTLYGGEQNDRLEAGYGDDLLYGESGEDKLFGEVGSDTLNGGDDKDWLDGGQAADTLNGGDGNDGLHGNAGDDEMNGDGGSDRFWFGTGNDTATGGADADSFHFFRYGGHDTITDLNVAEGDMLWLKSNLWEESHGTLTEAEMIAEFASINSDGNVVLSFDTGDSMTLEGITTTDGLEEMITIA